MNIHMHKILCNSTYLNKFTCIQIEVCLYVTMNKLKYFVCNYKQIEVCLYVTMNKFIECLCTAAFYVPYLVISIPV